VITFNKPHITGKETEYILDAVASKKLSGNGKYTKLCQQFFEDKYGFKKCLLTSSCTDALEMAALLLDLKPGDEVIMPSFTFVSTANAFVLRGAKIVFVDSMKGNPNMDAGSIEALITDRTRVIVPVHYAGIACDMDAIMALADKHNLFVVEDAAQAIDSFYVDRNGNKRPLGSIGHMSAFSFHETKNIISGEGGMLVINDDRFANRAEIIWEKGTNRSAFFRGEVDKYGWVDVGSSFLPSEIISAFLYAQLECLQEIQDKRKAIWQQYNEELAPLEKKGILVLPSIPDYATNNAHMFYVVCQSLQQRTRLLDVLRENNIHAVFHYQSLHQSEYYKSRHDDERQLLNSDLYTDTLIRLPMYFELESSDVSLIAKTILNSM
jgi:dTDP-4-amino-4,6-dideoxygalactose transaminase